MVSIKEITKEEDFRNLNVEWNRVLKKSTSPNIFLTWEWIYSWWTTYGRNKRLFILLAIDQNKRIVGIAPLYISEKKYLKILSIKEMKFLGFGEATMPFHLNFIILPEKEKEIINLIFKHLEKKSKEWDILNLAPLINDAGLWSKYSIAAINGSYKIKTSSSFVSPYIVLPESWEIYLKTRSSNFRHNLRRRFRRLEQKFKVEFQKCLDSSELDETLDRFIKLHRKRWGKREDKTGSLSTHQSIKYLKDVNRLFFNRDWLRFFYLKINNQLVSYLYCFKYNEKIYAYMIAYDTKWNSESVGTMLYAYIIKDSIAKGIKEFDFLGGDEAFKYNFTDLKRVNIKILVMKKNIKSNTYQFINYIQYKHKIFLKFKGRFTNKLKKLVISVMWKK